MENNMFSPGATIGINAASSAGNGLIGLATAAYQNKLQKNLFDYQFKKENARQDFLFRNQQAMQMQGLKNAGLNPALMSQGNFNTAAVSQPSPSASPGMPGNMDFVGSIIDMKRAEADINLANKQAEVAESQSALNYANAEKAKSEKVRIDTLTPHEQKQIIANSDFLSAQSKSILDQLPEQIRLLAANRLKAISGAALDYSHIDEVNANVRLLNAKVNEVNEHIRLMAKQIELNDAQIRNLDEQTKLYTAQTALADAQGDKVAADTAWQKFENNVRNIVGEKEYAAMVKKGFTREQITGYVNAASGALNSIGNVAKGVASFGM